MDDDQSVLLLLLPTEGETMYTKLPWTSTSGLPRREERGRQIQKSKNSNQTAWWGEGGMNRMQCPRPALIAYLCCVIPSRHVLMGLSPHSSRWNEVPPLRAGTNEEETAGYRWTLAWSYDIHRLLIRIAIDRYIWSRLPHYNYSSLPFSPHLISLPVQVQISRHHN